MVSKPPLRPNFGVGAKILRLTVSLTTSGVVPKKSRRWGNLGERDDHLPIGAGNIDFLKIINALKSCGYKETVTCEIFTENRKDLERSKKKFSYMFKEF